MEDLVELRAAPRAQAHFLNHEGRCIELWAETIALIATGIPRHLTRIPKPEKALFTVPLCQFLTDPNETIGAIIDICADESLERNHLFTDILQRLYRNLCRISGMVPNTEHTKPFISPAQKKLPPLEAPKEYLGGTPFYDLLVHPTPFAIPERLYFEHMHVIGGTGAGKTSWLSQLILRHIKDPDRPSVVVVDSQTDLIASLVTLEAIQDRLILIDPRDPPAINVFDTPARALETFDYLFSGIVGADLTVKQSVLFDYLVSLLLSLPQTLGRNATLMDFMDIMVDAGPYQAAIRQLPDVERRFFERDFNLPAFKNTKEEVRYRLHAILKDQTLKRLFTSPHTELDLYRALNRGAVVLIDTSREYLGKYSPHFGRIFIALILQALFARAPIPRGKRYPTHLIIDEADEYFDQNIDALLDKVRKYRCGCVLAHQRLSQCSPGLRSSLASNTAIKMASGVSDADARALAADMRTTSDFILSQKELHFATYVRKLTPQAFSVEVTLDALKYEPRVKRPSAHRRAPPTPEEKKPAAPPKKGPPRGPDDVDTGASESW